MDAAGSDSGGGGGGGGAAGPPGDDYERLGFAHGMGFTVAEQALKHSVSFERFAMNVDGSPSASMDPALKKKRASPTAGAASLASSSFSAHASSDRLGAVRGSAARSGSDSSAGSGAYGTPTRGGAGAEAGEHVKRRELDDGTAVDAMASTGLTPRFQAAMFSPSGAGRMEELNLADADSKMDAHRRRASRHRAGSEWYFLDEDDGIQTFDPQSPRAEQVALLGQAILREFPHTPSARVREVASSVESEVFKRCAGAQYRVVLQLALSSVSSSWEVTELLLDGRLTAPSFISDVLSALAEGRIQPKVQRDYNWESVVADCGEEEFDEDARLMSATPVL